MSASGRSDPSAASDRRVAPRLKSYAEVWADPGGVDPAIPCRIMDISTTGAKIDALGAELPDRFILHTGGHRHAAEVVWRRQTLVGVTFLKSVASRR